ncbi:MAG: caspase family protein [Spirochaetales bacterium]|nr:caspase family protein [Spirochaetales bacterium]
MKSTITAFLFLLILGSSLFGQTQDGQPTLQRFALFIGSNKGGENRQQLVYATKDALAMSRVLTDMGGVDRKNNILLEDPDKQAIDQSFTALKKSVQDAKESSTRTEFLLYYSGHSDEEGILLGEERYSYKELRENIEGVEADVHIAILDSCYSGAFTRLKGGTRRTPFLVDESVDTKGYAYLTSSSDNEAAQESDAIEGSFFTHYLIAALRGAADATSQDRKITLNEAYSYASGETLARTENTLAGPQHAMYDMDLTGSGEIVLTDLRTSDASVELKRDLKGRLFIRDNTGNLVAEIKKLEGIPLSFALPPGYYSATLQNENMIYEADLILRRGKNTVIALQDFGVITPEVTRVRGSGQTALSGEENVASDQHTPDSLSDELKEVKQEALEAIDMLKNRLRKTPHDGDTPQGPAFETPETHNTEIELIHRYNSISLVPTSFNSGVGIVDHNFSIHLVGSAYRIQGIELGLINLVDENVHGIQSGAVLNLVGGQVHGLQASGVFNLSDGDVHGAQCAGVFNLAGGDLGFLQTAGVFNIVSGSMNGLQTAGVFNITEGQNNGVQGAGVFNIVDGSVKGVQAAGVFNLIDGSGTGLQAAGMFNVSTSFTGTQLSLVNVNDTTAGFQGGLVNIGGDTSGVQIGLVNIAREMDGLAFGLINIAQNGLHNASFWMDDGEYLYGGYQMGSRPLYTILYFGGSQNDYDNKPLVSGLGMGVHFEPDPLFLDIDITAKNVSTGETDNEKMANLFNYRYDTVFPHLRATLGLRLGKHLSLIGGVGADIHLPGVTVQNEHFHSGTCNKFDYARNMEPAELYPTYFLGLRL